MCKTCPASGIGHDILFARLAARMGIANESIERIADRHGVCVGFQILATAQSLSASTETFHPMLEYMAVLARALVVVGEKPHITNYRSVLRQPWWETR